MILNEPLGFRKENIFNESGSCPEMMDTEGEAAREIMDKEALP